MAVARTLLHKGVRDRDLYRFDTYAGLPEPGDKDVSQKGKIARETWASQDGTKAGSQWCRAGLEEARRAMEGVGYPPERTHYVVGKVEDTVPAPFSRRRADPR